MMEFRANLFPRRVSEMVSMTKSWSGRAKSLLPTEAEWGRICLGSHKRSATDEKPARCPALADRSKRGNPFERRWFSGF